MISYLQVENLYKRFGEDVLFENISFGINKDQKVALIAKNGTGKTTLLNIIAGNDTADGGAVTFRKDMSVGYLAQDPPFNENLTLLEQVLVSSNEIITTIAAYEKALHSDNKHVLQSAIEKMDALEAWDYEVKIKQILSRLKLDNFDQRMGELSGGQRKRVALANVIINEPDLLILDEPTNHLDLEMIEWLEDYMVRTKSTLLMVTHDRYFLDRVCNEIIELDDQTIYRYRGNYSYFLEKRTERLQIRSVNIEKANALFRTELEWINRSPSARTTKSKSRIESFYRIQDDASQKIQDQRVEISVKTSRLGKKIVELYNLNKSYGALKLLDDFTYKFKRNDKIGIVGKNGSGKTTLLEILTGGVKCDSGKIEIGETVVIGYYKQSGIKLNEDKRIIDTIKDIAEIITIQDNRKTGSGKKLSAAQFLEYFLFPPESHYKYVSKLSGGERRRLYLMTILMQNPNFLILDEPTNDLDIVTLNVLEEYLNDFDGCVLVVSHDRFFMDKVVDTLFVFEEDGKVSHFPGIYTDYREQKVQQELTEKRAVAQEKIIKDKRPKKTVKLFNYREKREYEQLETELEQLGTEKSELENQINSGVLITNDLIEKSNRLGVVINLIDEKEFRWLELNELMLSDGVEG